MTSLFVMVLQIVCARCLSPTSNHVKNVKSERQHRTSEEHVKDRRIGRLDEESFVDAVQTRETCLAESLSCWLRTGSLPPFVTPPLLYRINARGQDNE